MQYTGLIVKGESWDGKKFSQNRSNFPRAGTTCGRTRNQRMREFQPHQVVAIRVGDPQSSRSEITRSLGQGVHRSQRRTGNFEQNLCGERQRAANRHQSSPR